MRVLKQWIMDLSLLLSIPLLTTIYRLLNRPDQTVYCLSTNLDRGIPFLKIFIVPYLGFYPFVFLTLCYLCYKDKNVYYKTLLAVNLSYIFSFIIYFCFQTTVPRPMVAGHDLLSGFVSFVYRTDQPYNAFPSLHVLTSFLMVKAVNRCSRCGKKVKFLVWGSAFFVIMSTQFVKQHVVLDLLAAIFLGDITFEMVAHLYGASSIFRVREWLRVTVRELLVVRQKYFR